MTASKMSNRYPRRSSVKGEQKSHLATREKRKSSCEWNEMPCTVLLPALMTYMSGRKEKIWKACAEYDSAKYGDCVLL